MHPVEINQSSTVTEVLKFGLPGDWVFHKTPSGRIDKYGYLKFIRHFSTIYGEILWSYQVFFNGHDYH